ncbi:MAG: type II secretion system F family protein [bacterium]|nr:type II secretion system F family protein [bacterium]
MEELKPSFNRFFFRLSLKEKMLFARNLEVMISSGMQILQSLEILKKQTRSKVFISILDQLIMDLKNGHFLSVGLERYRSIFGEFFINLIRVGEASGTLSENLKYLSEEISKKAELKKKVKGAMVYPIIILVATLGITGILTFFIFPKILPVLKNINVPLPGITLFFIWFSEFMLANGLWVLLGMVALIIGTILLLRIQSVRERWQAAQLHIPILNNMVKTVNLITFARTLGLLLKAGVKIVEAMEITSNTLSNAVYRKEVKAISENIRQGDSMSSHLISRPNLFPPLFSQMILVGENTGKMDESFLFLGNFYESEMDEATKSMSNFMEPALLLLMGLIVGFVALAIITPIYKVTQTLGR